MLVLMKKSFTQPFVCTYAGLGCVAANHLLPCCHWCTLNQDPSMEPMQGRAQTWMLIMLALCLLEHSHSQLFPFPIPFFAPSHTNQRDGEKNLKEFRQVLQCNYML